MSPEHLNAWKNLILNVIPDTSEICLLFTWDLPIHFPLTKQYSLMVGFSLHISVFIYHKHPIKIGLSPYLSFVEKEEGSLTRGIKRKAKIVGWGLFSILYLSAEETSKILAVSGSTAMLPFNF